MRRKLALEATATQTPREMSDDLADAIRVAIDEEDWGGARELLQRYAERVDRLTWLGLAAEVESEAGDLDRAAALYKELIERRPDHAAGLYNASVVFSDQGKHHDAMVVLEALVEVEGESDTVLNDLSYEYLEAGFAVPALLAARRALELSEDAETKNLARLNAAAALATMRRRSEALELLDALLSESDEQFSERAAAQELRASLDPRRPREPRSA